jgi:hypothetical protein
MVWTGFIWLRLSPVVSYCEHSNEASGSIKVGEFIIEQLSTYQLLKNDFSTWN